MIKKKKLISKTLNLNNTKKNNNKKIPLSLLLGQRPLGAIPNKYFFKGGLFLFAQV